MIYNFKFKQKWKRKSQYKYTDLLFTKVVYALYRNKLFQRLKLDKNESIKEACFPELRPFRNVLNIDFPEDPKLEVHSITFIDSVEIEHAQKLEHRLRRVTSRYKSAELFGEPGEKLRKTFAGFESFKTIVTGKFFRNSTKDNEELDLIDGITFGFIKCEQSHIVMTYTVHPSKKFHELFKHSLRTSSDEDHVINFNPLKTIIKTKRLYWSIGYMVKLYGHETERLFDEINYQFKLKVANSLKLGFYNRKKRLLFPQIVAFEYDQNEFSNLKKEYLNHFDISLHDQYDFGDITLSLRTMHSETLARSMEMFFPRVEKGYEAHNYDKHVGYISDKFISAVAPTWLLANVSSFYKQDVISLRKQTYRRIGKKRIGLFLRRAIKLRHKLTIDWISFERLRKDLSGNLIQNQLGAIPNAVNPINTSNGKKEEFKIELLKHTVYLSNGVKTAFEEILEQYRHINDENAFRANMRLQRILFVFVIIGTLLTLYTANSAWFNEWLKYWGFSLPHPPK